MITVLNFIKSVASISMTRLLLIPMKRGELCLMNQICDLKRLSLYPSVAMY